MRRPLTLEPVHLGVILGPYRAVALCALGAVGWAAQPEDDSNYSVQIGMFNYLPSFYASFNPTFGIIAGKAAMVRMAKSASTRSESQALWARCCPPLSSR